MDWNTAHDTTLKLIPDLSQFVFQVLWSGSNTGPSGQVDMNLLHWPSPLAAQGYAFTDRPRFTVPPWGPTPIPPGANVPPGTEGTNGYDFTNDVDGDTYVFLLGDSLESWWESRKEFLSLTGPTPLLPDVAYGIWYTWYVGRVLAWGYSTCVHTHIHVHMQNKSREKKRKWNRTIEQPGTYTTMALMHRSTLIG